MQAAIVHANVITASAGTTFSRITAGRNSPTSSTTRPPTARHSSGENAFQSMCGPLMWAAASSTASSARHHLTAACANFAARPAAAWACAGAIVARSVGSERLSPNCG